MRAIRFHYRPLRYLATRVASRRVPTAGLGRFGFVRLDDIERPVIPGPDWVRVESRLSGICGSDLDVITAHDSFTLEPFGAYPFTFGHEIVGTVAETGTTVERWKRGDRVVVNPMLACLQRGADPCGACARGDYGLCRRVGDGTGSMTGFSTTTGGGWSRYLVAHESQLHLQGDLADDVAVLADPFASAAKGVLLEPPEEEKEFLIQPSETEPCGDTIEAGASCAVRIVFLPQRGGTGMASLLIESDGTNPATTTRKMRYTAKFAEPTVMKPRR